jgi:hypothetical protein
MHTKDALCFQGLCTLTPKPLPPNWDRRLGAKDTGRAYEPGDTDNKDGFDIAEIETALLTSSLCWTKQICQADSALHGLHSSGEVATAPSPQPLLAHLVE